LFRPRERAFRRRDPFGWDSPPGVSGTRPDIAATKERHMAGEMDQAKGRIKQAAGDLTDNEDLKNEGKVDEAAGGVKGKVDAAKDWVEDKVDDVTDRAKKS
jgi:uncharacterized protein YjbJ (UPF0337 family)